MRSPRPLVPFPTNVGLLEKRLNAFSPLVLTQSAVHKGIWFHEASNLLEADDEVSTHKNNAEDPGAVTLNLSDGVAFSWLFNRSLSDTLNLNDAAHASLDGYHPPTEDLSQYEAIFNSDAIIGQPVYVAGSGYVDLARNDDIVTSEVIGLAYSNTLAGQKGLVLTDGSIEREDWTPITGTTNLVPGDRYFLDSNMPIGGKLTRNPPSVSSFYVVRVGRAFTNKRLDIEIGQEILL